jgi:hypothetical protein
VKLVMIGAFLDSPGFELFDRPVARDPGRGPSSSPWSNGDKRDPKKAAMAR